MRTINMKNSTSTPNNITVTPLEPEDRQPCWYVNLKDEDDRSNASWTVGLKEEGQSKQEYSFKLTKVGDVTDDAFWTQVTSLDFALELIDTFRSGGEKAVINWIKNGCL